LKPLAFAAVLCCTLPSLTTAQVDSLRDTTRADTAHVDSVPPGRTFVTTFPAALIPGPLPWAVRQVFDVDSLRFIGAMTLGDVLTRIPGVFIGRGGFLGQAEPAFYGGRGAAGIEIYWDGMPLRPLGRDSVFLDVGRIPLAPLERIEVQRLPDRLRVDLVTARPGDTEPRSAIGLTTGDLDIADYRASFARRWVSGFGVSLLADFNSLDGDNGTTTGFRSNDIWLKVEFVRPRVGGAYQLVRSGWEREARANLVDHWKTARYDHSFRAFVASRRDGLGWRVQGSVSLSGMSIDSALARPDRVTISSLELSHRWSRAGMSVVGRFVDDARPREAEWHAGWLVLPWLTLSSSARYVAYSNDQSGSRMAATAGIRLPLGLAAQLDVVRNVEISAPRLLLTDPMRQTVSWLGAVRWDTRWFTVEVARTEREPFQPAGAPRGLRPVALLGATPSTSELTVQGAIRPVPGLTLSGSYADPIQGGGDFQPPHHARYAATFFSKFWRVYRSGVFALRAEVAAESWSRGLGGVARDSLGATSQLFVPGATFLDLQLEIQIVGVTIFWQMRNANAMRTGYVSGLGYPTIVQFYGARWTFLN